MSARFWKVTFLGCVGLQTLAALTTIALEASTYRFEKEHAGRKFVLSHNEDDSLLMIDYIPPGLGERARRIAIGTSLSCIKLAIIVVAFTLFANANRKRVSYVVQEICHRANLSCVTVVSHSPPALDDYLDPLRRRGLPRQYDILSRRARLLHTLQAQLCCS